MAQHKAPTSVSVAPLGEKSPFEQFISRYWIHGVIVLAGVLGIVIYRHQKERSIAQVRDVSWGRIDGQTSPDQYTKIPTAPPDVLASLSTELRQTDAGPSARLLEIRARMESHDFDGAAQALQTLRADFKEHPLVTTAYVFAEGEAPETMPDHLGKLIQLQKSWDAGHPEWFANPPLPANAPRVRLNTDKGAIVLGLDPTQAPKHCENFIKLCQSGYYNGTKFHRITSSPGLKMIQGGDPNSKEGLPSTWGQGGPGYKIDHEPSQLHHFAGVLSMAKQPRETESSGSQFFITFDPAHHLDGQHVVFGSVIEGMDVVRQIGMAPLAAGTQDRPESPVTIVSAEVLP
jgi:cyclophilin family peptidyl-prolyl cis-trans isomerase